MQPKLKHALLICTGWFFLVLGIIGAVLPLLPTTPLLIIALACFAESSPRYHRMLLANKWFGPPLQQWQRAKTIRRSIKHKALLLIIVTFSISILVLSGRLGLQLMLMCIGLVLLAFIWRLKETK